MAKPKLLLYVDVVSPFAYIAFHVLNVSSNHLAGPVFMKGCLWRDNGLYCGFVSLDSRSSAENRRTTLQVAVFIIKHNRLVTAG